MKITNIEGTVTELKAYFDIKFDSLKKEISEEQKLSTHSIIKKLKLDKEVSFRFSGNKKQFNFNSEIIESVEDSLQLVSQLKDVIDLEDFETTSFAAPLLNLDEYLKHTQKLIKKRNKLIRIADKSEAGWAAVDEYLSNEVAFSPDDEKKIRAVETRALRKKRVKDARVSQIFKLSISSLILHTFISRSLFLQNNLSLVLYRFFPTKKE